MQLSYATPASPQTTVAVKLNAKQVRGNLNVVVVGWNDTTNTVVNPFDIASAESGAGSPSDSGAVITRTARP